MKVAIDLDGALGDTRPLWRDWVEDASKRLDLAELPQDRGEAAAILDATAGNWRALLVRFAEDRAPVYLRPNAEASAALRRLEAAGAGVGVFTDAPAELARVALAQLGAARRVHWVEAGVGGRERLLARLGDGAIVVATRAELVAAAR
jgi:phosphoglycolate phosphatase-like HAD superfamily hydrolase